MSRFEHLDISPESVEVELDILLLAQTMQAKTLERAGILDGARLTLMERYEATTSHQPPNSLRRIPKPELADGTDMTRVAVCLQAANLFISKQLHPAIRFSTTRSIGDTIAPIITHSYVPLVEVIDNQLRPALHFTEAEVEMVDGMLDGLQQAKASGILSNLAPNLADIVNPNTSITKTPNPFRSRII